MRYTKLDYQMMDTKHRERLATSMRARVNKIKIKLEEKDHGHGSKTNQPK